MELTSARQFRVLFSIFLASLKFHKEQMMQSIMIHQRCILSATTATSKVSRTVIRCTSSSSIAAAAPWSHTNFCTNFTHKNCDVRKRQEVNPWLSLAAQQQQSSSFSSSSSSSSDKAAKKPRQKMVPRKAALHLTPKARDIFRKLIEATSSEGIKLKYEMSSQHALRMAFKFDLIKDVGKELSLDDEG